TCSADRVGHRPLVRLGRLTQKGQGLRGRATHRGGCGGKVPLSGHFTTFHHGTKEATTATVQSSRSSSMAAARSSGQGLENSTGRRSVGCTKPRRTACNH